MINPQYEEFSNEEVSPDGDEERSPDGDSSAYSDDEEDSYCGGMLSFCAVMSIIGIGCCCCCVGGIFMFFYWLNGVTRDTVCSLTRDPQCELQAKQNPHAQFDPAYGATLDELGTAPICGSTKWVNCIHQNMHKCGDSCCCDPGFIYQQTNCRCNPENYILKNFPKQDIAQEMLYANCNGITAVGKTVPKQWGGLWWMDGNPAPETVASFANALWEPGAAGCQKAELKHYTAAEKQSNTLKDQFGDEVPCQGRMLVPFWEDRMWAMPDTKMGVAYAEVGTKANSNMEFVCGGPSPDDLTICKVGASTGPDGTAYYKTFMNMFAGAGGQAFNAMANFAMVRVNENYWIRYSLSDGSYPYYLKRIVGCDGKPGPYWDLFMSNGMGVPPRDKDTYAPATGEGRADTREHVANVTEMQFVRWNQEPAPMGSGWTCSTDTGGSCKVTGCSSVRNAECVDGRCMCRAGDCQEAGVCSAQIVGCSRDTGGTCAASSCDGFRHASCINKHCLCSHGMCEVDGVCTRPR